MGKGRPVPPTHHLKSAIRKIDEIIWKLHDEQLATMSLVIPAVVIPCRVRVAGGFL